MFLVLQRSLANVEAWGNNPHSTEDQQSGFRDVGWLVGLCVCSLSKMKPRMQCPLFFCFVFAAKSCLGISVLAFFVKVLFQSWGVTIQRDMIFLEHG